MGTVKTLTRGAKGQVMKTAFTGLGVVVGSFVAASAAWPTAVARADAGYKIILNGQDITAQGRVGTAQCGVNGIAYEISTDSADPSVIASTYPPQVASVELDWAGKEWFWARGLPGNAAATKSGNTFCFTGNIPPVVVRAY
jgi:Mycobacterium 19 kDa lipoprotein antigen